MLKNFAQDLKNFRESKNISLNDIYFKTKIHPSNFEKLESGNFNFQPQTYIRAFLKQYAISLELDENEVLRNYDLAKIGKYHPKTKHTEEPVKEQKSSPYSELLEDKEKTESKKITSDTKTEESPQNYVKPKSTFYDAPSKNHIAKILKFAGGSVIVILVIIGVYLLAKNMFFNKQPDNKTEIVRQNFDDVVKEREKKDLGKRTPQEIQDSVARAQKQKDSLNALKKDSSIVLRVEAKKEGNIIIVADSVNLKKREVEKLDKNKVIERKAYDRFLITSRDITAFDIRLNGKKIKFEDKSVKDFKITRKSISQE